MNLKILTISLLLTISTMSLAQTRRQPNRGAAHTFGQLDRNRSGAIEAFEWPGDPAYFQWLDSDRNGSVDRNEYRASGDTFAQGQRFASMDTNRDGRISREEWTGDANLFIKLDTNEDSQLTREEFVGQDTRFRKRTGTVTR